MRGFSVKIHAFLISTLIIFSSTLAALVPPDLSPKKVKNKIEALLGEHVRYHALDRELMERVMKGFLNQLDPMKVYLTKGEVLCYVEPTQEVLDRALADYRQARFDLFEEMYRLMIEAIARRNRLESSSQQEPLPKSKERFTWKELDWAEDEKALHKRLSELKALQLDTAAAIEWKDKKRFSKLLDKRRRAYENTLRQPTTEKRKKQLFVCLLKAFATALDHHTNYLTPDEVKQFMVQIEQRLSGIGVQLRDDIDGMTVMHILKGGPASLDGKLRIKDRIVAVDGDPIAGMDVRDAVEKVRGPKGTTVALTVLREKDEGAPCEKLEVVLLRDEVELSETRLETKSLPFGEGVIAVIHLFSFYQKGKDSSAQDIRQALEKIGQTATILGVILDLRSNAGGVLPQAVDVCGLFMRKGIVVSVKDNQGGVHHLRNYNETPIWTGPLLVLTNKGTASCGEIVAQTLQDYGRALVVGDATTWGKGSYQKFTLEISGDDANINPEGEFKVTRGLYYTVSGKSPQLTGMTVDIEVPGPLSKLKIGEAEEKFPLDKDAIAPSFVDDLADISPLYRWRMQKLYSKNREKKTDRYRAHLPILKANSALRLASSQNYQNFLKAIEAEQDAAPESTLYGQNDLQLEETGHLMKDLIWLTRFKKPQVPTSAQRDNQTRALNSKKKGRAKLKGR